MTVFSNSVLLGTSSFNWATEKRSHVVVELGAWRGPGFERGEGGGGLGTQTGGHLCPRTQPTTDQPSRVGATLEILTENHWVGPERSAAGNDFDFIT